MTIWLAAVRTPDPWRIEPGQYARILYKTREAWRPIGLRFGQRGLEDEIRHIVLERFECDGHNQIVGGPIPCTMLGPPLTSGELALFSAEPTLIASSLMAAVLWEPEVKLTLPTVASGGEIVVTIQNTGAVAHLVHGAIFFNVRRGG